MLLHIEANDKTESFAHDIATATFGQLKDLLSRVSRIPRDIIMVKLGTPPTAIDYPDNTLLAHTPFYGNSHVVVAARAENANHHSHPQMLPPVDRAPPYPTHHHMNPPILPPPLDRVPPHHQTNHFQEPLPPMLPPVDYMPSYHHQPRENIGAAWAEFKDGFLVRRTVPSDNSCLFTSLSMCLGYPGLTPQSLRQIVCECIREDPERFNEAVLGMPVEQYCRWIQQPDNWGGGIEMAAISSRYHVEICSLDIKTLRIDRFGEGKYARRVVVLYSGSHYDYVAQVASIGDPRDFDQTEFETGFTSTDDDALLSAALTLAGKLNDGNGFVNTQAELKCESCGVLVRGEHGARQHAAATRHGNFKQI
ncbi:ubiquitin-specific protease otu1 [Coemansia sp. RSA 1933]|nr:ubiquitin-specific protease otu1 [Coemansia sp. RSA 1933]